jgi:hypothetical protein
VPGNLPFQSHPVLRSNDHIHSWLTSTIQGKTWTDQGHCAGSLLAVTFRLVSRRNARAGIAGGVRMVTAHILKVTIREPMRPPLRSARQGSGGLAKTQGPGCGGDNGRLFQRVWRLPSPSAAALKTDFSRPDLAITRCPIYCHGQRRPEVDQSPRRALRATGLLKFSGFRSPHQRRNLGPFRPACRFPLL